MWRLFPGGAARYTRFEPPVAIPLSRRIMGTCGRNVFGGRDYKVAGRSLIRRLYSSIPEPSRALLRASSTLQGFAGPDTPGSCVRRAAVKLVGYCSPPSRNSVLREQEEYGQQASPDMRSGSFVHQRAESIQ